MSDDIAKRIAAELEAKLFATIVGPQRKQRPRAMRLVGNTIESVELDDAGNVIEPVRCTCGSMIVLHRPACPFYCLAT